MYSDLTNGQLLAELEAIALEARDRVAVYADRAEDDPETVLLDAITYAERVDEALSPTRGFLTDVASIKRHQLLRIARNRPVESSSSCWSDFLDAHPELGEAPAPAPVHRRRNAPPRRVMLDLSTYDDDAVVRAVEAAIQQDGSPDAAAARAVAVALLGENYWDDRVRVRSCDVIRVGMRLGKLARAGRIRLASRPYEQRCYETVEGESGAR